MPASSILNQNYIQNIGGHHALHLMEVNAQHIHLTASVSDLCGGSSLDPLKRRKIIMR